VTYPPATIEGVLEMVVHGVSQAEISRWTGISRSAIRDWSRGRLPTGGARHGTSACPLIPSVPPAAYAYLLGLYLGDGCISATKNVFRLRIQCCDRYPHLMDLCQEAIQAVMPHNVVGRRPRVGCTELTSYSTHWPCLFPQHGPGRKHERAIVLSPWQGKHVRAHTKEFLRGLIHSDGCRGLNTVSNRLGKRYSYPRYTFTNASDDIRELFCWACDRIGVDWKVMNARNISINKRADVAFLDTFIGPKT
jgi:hypothetical protein